MSRVRRADTKPELAVRRIAHRLGYRFRLHRRDLPGSPDIVFPRHRKVVFVHGCFWHGHEGCRRGRLPVSRREYWANRIGRNRARDARVAAELEATGWKALTVWECQIGKDPVAVEKALSDFLTA